MIDDIQTTTVLGSLYRDDPQAVETHLAELHDEVVARRAEEEEAWAAEVADPDAAKELEHAARLFAEENDLEWEEVRSEPATNVHVTYQVNVNPYPYWFGYPYWYNVAYWYPRPVWGHVGFYYGYGSGYVSVGLPSPYFLGWYHRTYVPRYRAAYRNGHYGRGYKSYRSGRYYDRHRPHSSAGQRRHHDLTKRRAHLDTRRPHGTKLRSTAPETRRHRGSRYVDAHRSGSPPHGQTTRRARFERPSSPGPTTKTNMNSKRGTRQTDPGTPRVRTKTTDRPKSTDRTRSGSKSDRSARRQVERPESRTAKPSGNPTVTKTQKRDLSTKPRAERERMRSDKKPGTSKTARLDKRTTKQSQRSGQSMGLNKNSRARKEARVEKSDRSRSKSLDRRQARQRSQKSSSARAERKAMRPSKARGSSGGGGKGSKARRQGQARR